MNKRIHFPLFNLFGCIFVMVLFGNMASLHAQLSGIYTIDPNKPASSTNYYTLSAVKADLKSGYRADGATPNGPGISGPVTFLFADGTHTVSLDLNSISGVSSVNTIKISSLSGDSSKVILTPFSSSQYSEIFTIYDYTTISHVTLKGNANIITINGSNNTINNCRISGDGKYYTSDDALIIGNKDNNIIKNNIIYKGVKGILLPVGSSTTPTYERENFLIEDNKFDSLSSTALDLYNTHNIIINKNIFQNSGGIDIAFAKSYTITNNYFRSTRISIRASSSKGTTDHPIIIANNNIISDVNNSVGIIALSNDSILIAHNSISLGPNGKGIITALYSAIAGPPPYVITPLQGKIVNNPSCYLR